MLKEYLFGVANYDTDCKKLRCGCCNQEMHGDESVVRFGGVWMCEGCVVGSFANKNFGVGFRMQRDGNWMTLDSEVEKYRLMCLPVSAIVEACER